MTRIAILDDYCNGALAATDWSVLGADIEVFTEHLGHDEDKVASALASFDVLVAMRERTPFPASLLAKLPNLKLLITTGMRNLAIDMVAGRTQGIDICGTAMLPYPAFEHTWALIMALTKQIPLEDRTMKSGGWQKGTGVGLNGKTLGIVGLGKLGAQVARVGKAFEMDIIAWSQNLTDERCAEVGNVARVEKDELFRRADVISVQMVLSDRSRGLIGAHEFSLMKPSAYFINTSRGPIVDEAALLDVMQNNKIAGAGIDVYDVEPLAADHPYRKLDNMVLTGHTGYVIKELYEVVYAEAVENVKAWSDGAPTRLLNA
jgi:phosphoglycerate dehydrogenase-like enzyme